MLFAVFPDRRRASVSEPPWRSLLKGNSRHAVPPSVVRFPPRSCRCCCSVSQMQFRARSTGRTRKRPFHGPRTAWYRSVRGVDIEPRFGCPLEYARREPAPTA
jgi:hypothetical protein